MIVEKQHIRGIFRNLSNIYDDDFFVKIVYEFQPLTIFAKNFIIVF